VEINPSLCKAAEENFALNGVENAHVLVCDSAKFANNVLRTKRYTIKLKPPVAAPDVARVANCTEAHTLVEQTTETTETMVTRTASASATPGTALENNSSYTFAFGAVLVDPPRCGLDKLTLSLIVNYAHIMYISCCPDSLMRDLASVSSFFIFY
jgi:tRNA/tmRNA/rRNA uracil-C5-methylase (TrmA/RlmC/RlmD family)